MKKITMNSVINCTLFMYILSLYIFTYQEELNIVSNILALVLVGLITLNFFMRKKKLIFNKVLFYYSLFIISCLFSIFFAIDGNTAFIKSTTLIMLFVLMISLINYIDNLDKVYKLMRYFAMSGFITSIYILINSDFSNTSRIGGELGNVNTIGMIIVISVIFFNYFILEEKKNIYIPMSLTCISIVLLTGSRTALFFLIFSFFAIWISKTKNNIKERIRYFVIAIGIIVLILYATFNIPAVYQSVGIRIESLWNFLMGEGTSEGSVNIRLQMLKLGVDWFSERPILGYGIDNYQFLLGHTTGDYTYAHNNIVELLVGIGIIGTFLFYMTHVAVLKDLIRNKSETISRGLSYTFITILLGYTITSAASIYYYNKHFSIILTISSVLMIVSKKEAEKSASQKQCCSNNKILNRETK